MKRGPRLALQGTPALIAAAGFFPGSHSALVTGAQGEGRRALYVEEPGGGRLILSSVCGHRGESLSWVPTLRPNRAHLYPEWDLRYLESC